MNDFYDLNDFFAFVLRRLKICIIIVVLGIAGFAAVRFYNCYQEYVQSQQMQTDNAEEGNVGDEPIWKRANIVISIDEPELVGQISRAESIAAALYGSAYANDVFSQLSDMYFETSSEEDVSNKEKLYEYGYILDKERNYPYTMYDFQQQFKVEYTKNIVTFYFMSMSESYSKEVVGTYETLLVNAVKESLGDFSYSIVEEGVNYQLPSASTGAIPTRYKSNSASASSSMAFSTVIKQTIKGCVWGAVLGAVCMIIIMFLIYMMSQKVLVLNQLRRFELYIYGTVCSQKRSKLTNWLRKRIGALEGNQAVFDELASICALVSKDPQLQGQGKIAVTGTVDFEFIDQLIVSLNDLGSNNSYKAYENNSIQDIDKVILVEKLGKSYKNEIEKEIKKISEQKIQILGIVVAE